MQAVELLTSHKLRTTLSDGETLRSSWVSCSKRYEHMNETPPGYANPTHSSAIHAYMFQAMPRQTLSAWSVRSSRRLMVEATHQNSNRSCFLACPHCPLSRLSNSRRCLKSRSRCAKSTILRREVDSSRQSINVHENLLLASAFSSCVRLCFHPACVCVFTLLASAFSPCLRYDNAELHQ